MDIMQRAGAWIIGRTHISVMLLTLGIVWGVLFGAAVTFVGGDVIGNIIGVVTQLGNAGLIGLIALVIVVWLFRHQSRFDDALD